jgi:hypothetical protein
MCRVVPAVQPILYTKWQCLCMYTAVPTVDPILYTKWQCLCMYTAVPAVDPILYTKWSVSSCYIIGSKTTFLNVKSLVLISARISLKKKKMSQELWRCSVSITPAMNSKKRMHALKSVIPSFTFRHFASGERVPRHGTHTSTRYVLLVSPGAISNLTQ